MKRTYDFAVVGAGVFGAWIAQSLRQSGATVILLDAYGPGNSRSSSGGETRIIRMGYGPDELYTRWAMRSFPLWREFLERTGNNNLFVPTGVLWLGHESDSHLRSMCDLLDRLRIKYERLAAGEIEKRYPQFCFADVTLGVLEPKSGVLLARRAVAALVRDLEQRDVTCMRAEVLPPPSNKKLAEVKTEDGGSAAAGVFIFACGAWLPKLFPNLLAGRIFPTRQEVFFIGTGAGSLDFQVGQMPAWLHHTHPERPYALPDIENRGFKVAFDVHGPEFDPEQGARVVSAASIDRLRSFLSQHVPLLEYSPIIETRVCQYENTWNGDFLIDRHPGFDNVWLVGGGSGHGFKHGPAVAEYLAARILHNANADHRFSLASKQTRQLRAVY